MMIPPCEDLRYTGRVAVMVGPACASACEFFSYDLTLKDRATIVGQYPSEGAGGSVEAFYMPEGIYCQLTIGRALDANGNIHSKGRGVVPGIKVPVTADTLQRQAAGEDVVLQAAVEGTAALSPGPTIMDQPREKEHAAPWPCAFVRCTGMAPAVQSTKRYLKSVQTATNASPSWIFFPWE